MPSKHRLIPVKHRPGLYYRGTKVVGYAYDATQAGSKKWIGTHAAVKDAWAAKLKHEEKFKARAHKTVAEFFVTWKDGTPDKRQSSIISNMYAVRPFAERYGDTRLDELPYDEVRDWGKRAPLGQVKAARAFLYDAVDSHLCGENPLARLGRKESRGRADITILTADELYDLANTAEKVLGPEFGPVFRAQILFSAHTCIRPAELFALRVSHLDATSVDIACSRGRTGIVTTPKNHQTRRIVLPPPALRAIAGLNRPPNCPYVFWSKTGRMLSYSAHNTYWDPVRKAWANATNRPDRLGMDYYELRHYGAAWLLNIGGASPEAVAFQLGHTGKTGIDLVLRLYGHPSEQRYRQELLSAYDRFEQPNVRPLPLADAA